MLIVSPWYSQIISRATVDIRRFLESMKHLSRDLTLVISRPAVDIFDDFSGYIAIQNALMVVKSYKSSKKTVRKRCSQRLSSVIWSQCLRLRIDEASLSRSNVGNLTPNCWPVFLMMSVVTLQSECLDGCKILHASDSMTIL